MNSKFKKRVFLINTDKFSYKNTNVTGGFSLHR